MPITRVARWDDLEPSRPAYALVAGVDRVVIRAPDDDVSVLYGRCRHRGALLADGALRRGRLVCGVHGSTYDIATGIKCGTRAPICTASAPGCEPAATSSAA